MFRKSTLAPDRQSREGAAGRQPDGGRSERNSDDSLKRQPHPAPDTTGTSDD